MKVKKRISKVMSVMLIVAAVVSCMMPNVNAAISSGITFTYDGKMRPGITIDESVVKSGYMYGRPDWKFAADDTLTRAEFSTILDRVLKFDNENTTKKFEDSVGHWAESFISRLATNNIIVGVSSKEFDPDGELTRDQVLLMLSRVINIDDNATTCNGVDLRNHYSSRTLAQVLNAGVYDSIPSNYDVNAVITRGEMVHIINNVIGIDTPSASAMESYLKQSGKFSDLVGMTSYAYYKDCLSSINTSYAFT